MNSSDVACPFCGESGFDLIGLKLHLIRGWCDRYEAVDHDYTKELARRAVDRAGADQEEGGRAK